MVSFIVGFVCFCWGFVCVEGVEGEEAGGRGVCFLKL